MPSLWFLLAIVGLSGVVAGALYVWGFRYMLARKKVSPIWGIVLPPIVTVLFFIFPLSIFPAPVPENPKLLFNYYTAGFALPVLVALVRFLWDRLHRTK